MVDSRRVDRRGTRGVTPPEVGGDRYPEPVRLVGAAMEDLGPRPDVREPWLHRTVLKDDEDLERVTPARARPCDVDRFRIARIWRRRNAHRRHRDVRETRRAGYPEVALVPRPWIRV